MNLTKSSHPCTLDNVCDRVALNTHLPKSLLMADYDTLSRYPLPLTYKLNGMDKATSMIIDAYKQNQRIYIYLDYDLDGIGGAVNCYSLFTALGTEVTFMTRLDEQITTKVGIYVPDRYADGYGLRKEFIDAHSKERNVLLLTVDNGISAISQIAEAKEYGWNVLVLDHHEPIIENGTALLPPADCILAPSVTGGDCTDYCGAGLVYKLAENVLSVSNRTEELKKFFMEHICCCTALSTIADSVPLVSENYLIVKRGLHLLSEGRCGAGLKTLADRFGLTGKPLTVSMLAYGVVAALNAPERLFGGEARRVTALLSYGLRKGEYDAVWLNKEVTDVIEMNNTRKQLTNDTLSRCMGTENESSNRFCISVYDPKCRLGLVGLVAGRLCEEYHVPSICFTDDNEAGIIKGSARSPKGINIKEVFDRIKKMSLDMGKDMIVSYGGHECAAGISIRRSEYESFVSLFRSAVGTRRIERSNAYDFIVTPQNAALYANRLSVFLWGEGNPEPHALIYNMEIGEAREIGKEENGGHHEHIKLTSKTDTWKDPKIELFASARCGGTAKYREDGSYPYVTAYGTMSNNIYTSATGNTYITPQMMVEAFGDSDRCIYRFDDKGQITCCEIDGKEPERYEDISI